MYYTCSTLYMYLTVHFGLVSVWGSISSAEERDNAMEPLLQYMYMMQCTVYIQYTMQCTVYIQYTRCSVQYTFSTHNAVYSIREANISALQSWAK